VYMGFIISKEFFKMDLKQVKAILGLPTPKCISDLINFHSLASFYRKFIQNSNEICAPLTHCMKKGNFQWTTRSMKSFNNLKMKVIR